MYIDLNLNLTDQQKMLKETFHKFAKEVLRPASVIIDQNPEVVFEKDSVWMEVRRKARKLGIHTYALPTALGGLGLSPLDLHILWEELGWGASGLCLSLMIDAFPANMCGALQPGNEKLLNEIILPLIDDMDAKIISCWAGTEPNHGSDVVMVNMPQFKDPNITFNVKAILQGDEWIINGQKSSWVSNGPVANLALVFLNIDNSKGMAGGGVAVVPLDVQGVTQGKSIKKLGQRDFPQGEVIFENVRIPKEYMLVGPEAFELVAEQIFVMANCLMAATFTGAARAAFEEALNYSKQRIQGGKPICEHQLVQAKIFDMFSKVETARAMSRAALEYSLSTTPMPHAGQYASLVKTLCTQTAFEVAHDALQLFGGYGLTNEYLIEKLFRDARPALIEDGNNEILGIKSAQSILRNYQS